MYFKMPVEHKCITHDVQQLLGCYESWMSEHGWYSVRRCFWEVDANDNDHICRAISHRSSYEPLMDAVGAYLIGKMVAVRLEHCNLFCELVRDRIG